jgi:hypothetical protein
MSERFCRLEFTNVDPQRLGAGVFLFEVIKDGRVMDGWQAFYSAREGAIDAMPVCAFRPDAKPRPEAIEHPAAESLQEQTQAGAGDTGKKEQIELVERGLV